MATTTRYVGTCPVCEGRIKVRGGTLVHHGYQRPGYGHIVGDCFGVNRLPHETSPETAKAYRDEAIVPRIAACVRETARVETATVLAYTYERRLADRQKVPAQIEVKQGDPPSPHVDEVDRFNHLIPSFDQVRRVRLANLESEIRMLERDNERLTKLVDTWSKQELTTVEEETAKGRESAEAKRAEKTAARDAKKAEKARRDAERAARYQAKIDKALAKCLPILDAVDPSDLNAVRNAYLEVTKLKLDLPAGERWDFFERLPETHKATVKAAGLYSAHNGRLFFTPEEVSRVMWSKR